MENLNEGLTILVVGMLIVFLSLLLLYTVFGFLMPNLLNLKIKKPIAGTSADERKKEEYATGDEMAAIATAIYLFLEEAHDEENAIVTINKVAKNYSPWSSKIYTTHRFQ